MHSSRWPAPGQSLAAGDGADDEEWQGAISYGFRQRRVWRIVGYVFLCGEKSDTCATGAGLVVEGESQRMGEAIRQLLDDPERPTTIKRRLPLLESHRYSPILAATGYLASASRRDRR